MATHRSALGRQVDMGALFAKNEKARAVGNMRVNARGDTIDSNGKILVPVTEKVNQNYSKSVGSKTARPGRKLQTESHIVGQNTPQMAAPQAARPAPEPKSKEEMELDEFMEDDHEIEMIKKAQTKK